jgi:hypothetical protein
MKLQLPAERPLQHPDQMVDAILTEAPQRKPIRPARVYWLSGLVAAAAAITATAIGVTVLGSGARIQVGTPPSLNSPTFGSAGPSSAASTPSPSASATPSATTEPSVQPTKGASPTSSPSRTAVPTKPVVNPIGTSTRFANFVVTVSQTKWNEALGLLVEAEACVVKLPPNSTGETARIGWDLWTVTTSAGTVQPELPSAAQPPQDLFPKDGSYQVHECATGWIPFPGVRSPVAFTKINYGNELGNRATWLPTVTTAPIGQLVKVPYLDVTASGTMAGGDVYAILVETCVRGLPPGTPSSGLQLGRDDWTLATSEGTVTTSDPIHFPIPLPSTYPETNRLTVGECASGWIPFGAGHDTAVFAINYHNSLGGSVVWDPQT